MKTRKIAMILFLVLAVLLQALGTVSASAAGSVPADASGTDPAFAPGNVPASTSGTDPATASASVPISAADEETGSSTDINPTPQPVAAESSAATEVGTDSTSGDEPSSSVVIIPSAQLPDWDESTDLAAVNPSATQSDADESPDSVNTPDLPQDGDESIDFASAIPEVPQPETDDSPTLRIYSGYEGQETSAFQLLAEYTIEDLEQMELMEEDYTLLDQQAGVFVCHALGVRLQEILEHAGIETDDIESLAFQTDDGRSVEIDTDMILQDPRYCYFDLANRYDPSERKVQGDKSGPRQKVLTMIAWQELWLCSADYETEELYSIWRGAEEMSGEHAFHLLFGQSEIDEDLADHALAEVTKIIAFRKGSPPVTETPEIGESDAQDDGDRTMSAEEAATSEPRTGGEGTGADGKPDTEEDSSQTAASEADGESGGTQPGRDPYQVTENPSEVRMRTGSSAGIRISAPTQEQKSRTGATDQPSRNSPDPVSPSEQDTVPLHETESVERIPQTIPLTAEPVKPPASVTSAFSGTAGDPTMPRSTTSTTQLQVTEWELWEIESGSAGASDLTPAGISPQGRSPRSQPRAGEIDTASPQEEEKKEPQQAREPNGSPADTLAGTELSEPEPQEIRTNGRIYEITLNEGEKGSRLRGYIPASGSTISRRTLFLLFGIPFLMGGLIESIYVWWSYGGPDRLKWRR